MNVQNILYDALSKAELIEMVLKSLNMSTKDIQKVRKALENKLKETTQ